MTMADFPSAGEGAIVFSLYFLIGFRQILRVFPGSQVHAAGVERVTDFVEIEMFVSRKK